MMACVYFVKHAHRHTVTHAYEFLPERHTLSSTTRRRPVRACALADPTQLLPQSLPSAVCSIFIQSDLPGHRIWNHNLSNTLCPPLLLHFPSKHQSPPTTFRGSLIYLFYFLSCATGTSVPWREGCICLFCSLLSPQYLRQYLLIIGSQKGCYKN